MKTGRARIAVIVCVVFAIMASYVFKLMQYQIVNGETYRQQSDRLTSDNVTIIAPRGEILDRYGRVLATNDVTYSVIIESILFPPSGKIAEQDKILLTLCSVLTQNGKGWVDELPVSLNKPYSYTGSKKDVTALIKYIDTQARVPRRRIKGKLHKAIKYSLSTDASADQVMDALEKIYSLGGKYQEPQIRTLCGIRYEMAKKEFFAASTYTFATDIDLDTATKILELSTTLPGVEIQEVPKRSYPNGTVAPQVLGTVGPIYADEYKKLKNKGYSMDAIIGRSGIEKQEENYLKGENGSESVEVDKQGGITGKTVTKQPKPGNNVILSIDMNQQLRMQSMLPEVIQQIRAAAGGNPMKGSGARAAAGVVLDIKTGQVMAMASYPTYDINEYKNNYSALAKDQTSPLLDRCIQSTYRPGSTFKPIVATAGLMNGIIGPDTVWNCPAAINVGGISFHDDADESRTVNVKKALAVSSNVFFMKLGMDLGITPIDKVAKEFGIGQSTGIELPHEHAGVMSGPDEKGERSGEKWYVADTAQASIGQFDTLISPLQLANYVSTMLKCGTRYQVHVIKQINTYDNKSTVLDNSQPNIVSDVDAATKKSMASAVSAVKEGMRDVTEDGTANTVFQGFNMPVGGKTGTAQIPNGFNGVYIGFAPYDDPQIAIAIVVEYGYNGYQTAPAAKAAIEQYFGLDDNGNKIPVATSNQTLGQLLQ